MTPTLERYIGLALFLAALALDAYLDVPGLSEVVAVLAGAPGVSRPSDRALTSISVAPESDVGARTRALLAAYAKNEPAEYGIPKAGNPADSDADTLRLGALPDVYDKIDAAHVANLRGMNNAPGPVIVSREVQR